VIANFRMYEAVPSAARAWRSLFERAFSEVGLDMPIVEHKPPAPLRDLYAREDLGCAFMCGWPFVRSGKMQPIAAPVPSPPRYEHLPRRWVIERTFSWLGQNRRLSKDYEYLTDTSEILIYIAMARLMLRRLTGDPSAQPGRKRPPKRPKVLSNEAQMTLQTGT